MNITHARINSKAAMIITWTIGVYEVQAMFCDNRLSVNINDWLHNKDFFWTSEPCAIIEIDTALNNMLDFFTNDLLDTLFEVL